MPRTDLAIRLTAEEMAAITTDTLHLRPAVLQGHAQLFIIDSQGNEVSLGTVPAPFINTPSRPVPELSDQLPLFPRRDRRAWELTFREENIYYDYPAWLEEELGPIVEPVTARDEILMSSNLSLIEVAEKVPPGILGVHYLLRRPVNLVFRPKNPADPALNLLRGSGWFELKKHAPGVWHAAATLEHYNILLDTGLEFQLSKKVDSWRYFLDNTEMSSATSPVLENSPLFDYQKDGARFLFFRDRAMLSLSPGLGKTLTSAFAASLRGFEQVLLVCPASLLYYWRSELEKWSPHLPKKPFVTVLHGKEAKTDYFSRPPEVLQHWLITNPETVVNRLPFLMEMDDTFDCMIVDESIMYKHRDSKRSKAMLALAEKIPNVWLLTGAPATRYLDDLWHQFHMLNSRGYASYWRFAERYCYVENTPWAKTVMANKVGAEEQIKENFADIYFARSQEEVADIPDWLMEDIDIMMAPKQDEAYQRLLEELEYEIGDADDKEIVSVSNRFTFVLRSLQICSNPLLLGGENSSGKWNALPELMSLFPGPHIIWVNFVRTGEILLDTLKDMRVATMTGREGSGRPLQGCLVNGSTPMKDRQSYVDDFQAGKYDAIIMNNTVGKFGFTLTKARTAIFVERAYDDSYFQCLFRNRRIGTTQSPVVVNMRSITRDGERTIDHVVHDTLDYRNNMIRQLTVGDLRGLLHAKRAVRGGKSRG